MIGVLSPGILRIPYLDELLGRPVVSLRRSVTAQGVRTVAGWGLRPSSHKARAYAKRHQLPFVALEDGFLRSVELGNEDPPYSVVTDEIGVYYDANRPSALETLVAQLLTAGRQGRARSLCMSWREGRVSKYNHGREYVSVLPAAYVLVVDQTFGDCSIRYGMASPESFQRMLQAALDENPDCTVLVKIHPDVFAGKKRGHFDVAALMQMPRVQVLAENVHPVRLIEEAQAVYCVTSQMGFEALLWGKPVRTFGMPFYAGWGLTKDELPAPSRRRPVPLENLVHAALVDYPRYIDPETGKRCEVERLIEWMGLQRRMRERMPARVYALGFSRWKKPIVRDFLQGADITFVRRAAQIPVGADCVAVWGYKHLAQDDAASTASPCAVIRLEDGFLRSVGLGADLIRPLSWVMDAQGIYYGARQPSALESLLESGAFDAAILARAGTLRQRIVEAGLTKYNVGAGTWQRPAAAARVILVPGQVESDASIRYGTPVAYSNIELLRAVRTAHPDAYIVYKPHPDVVAGLRRQGAGEQQASQYCDEVVIDTPMAALLPAVDEVHVLTSLTGFEALLRGKPVTCYGQPFYAGWGLTRDIHPLSRRTRRLVLDELVTGALILYPTYVSRTTGRFTTPEQALDELLEWQRTGVSTPTWGQKAWRTFLRYTSLKG